VNSYIFINAQQKIIFKKKLISKNYRKNKQNGLLCLDISYLAAFQTGSQHY